MKDIYQNFMTKLVLICTNNDYSLSHTFFYQERKLKNDNHLNYKVSVMKAQGYRANFRKTLILSDTETSVFLELGRGLFVCINQNEGYF